MHIATKIECTTCIKMLIKFGASLKARDSNNYTPLHTSIAFGTGSALEILIAIGADPEEVWENKYRPIHLAA